MVFRLEVPLLDPLSGPELVVEPAWPGFQPGARGGKAWNDGVVGGGLVGPLFSLI